MSAEQVLENSPEAEFEQSPEQMEEMPAEEIQEQDPYDDKELENMSFKEVSEISEVTQESLPEGFIIHHGGTSAAAEDLIDFEKLKAQTEKKLQIADPEQSEQLPADTIEKAAKLESGDEFLRNFFIKFGMKKTLDSFQSEWFELKTKNELDVDQMPEIPEVYRENIELSNVLTQLQKEVDEARIIAEKSRSTYDKLMKQRDFQKIIHRRVQQEKQKLNNDIAKLKKKYENYQTTYEGLSNKYENAIKEKMLMKLEKDRLKAKVENLDSNLRQIKDDGDPAAKDKTVEQSAMGLGESPVKTHLSSQSKSPKKEISSIEGKTAAQFSLEKPRVTPIRKHDPPNPHLQEEYEPINAHMGNVKTFKSHLMGVTSLCYNPRKDILATGSDDTTWKLWSIPSGDLIMSGEGHQDWIGGVSFHPQGNFLATASGDGCVKIWDFVNAKCQRTFAEHGQPVWKVDFHDSGDFLISCSMDQSIKLWDMALPKQSRFTFRGHADSVNSVQWMPSSCMFVSGSADKTVSLWDIRTNLCVQTFYGHEQAVNSVKWNLTGDYIASADSDGFIKVWDVRMVKEACNFDCGPSSANCAIFDKASKYVLVATSENSTIQVMNLTTGEKDGELKGHEDSVLDLCFDNNKEAPCLISASSDCSFRLWQ